MNNVTEILCQIEQGSAEAGDKLLPLVYDELRRHAAARLNLENPGHTLQATALVHEAYLRLVGGSSGPHWESRRHFFAAAAEAMRRILIDLARRRQRIKRGGDRDRVPLGDSQLCINVPVDELLAVHDLLDQLAAIDTQAAELVKLRYFAGFSTEEAAEILGVSSRTAYRDWQFARAWLHDRLLEE